MKFKAGLCASIGLRHATI